MNTASGWGKLVSMKDKIYIVPLSKRKKAFQWYKNFYGLDKVSVDVKNGVTFETLHVKRFARLPESAIAYVKRGVPIQFYMVA